MKQKTYSTVIVDNDVLALQYMMGLVSKSDRFTISWTEKGGQEAFEHFQRSLASINGIPDLMLVDMSMRGISGTDLCEAIRYENETVILLGITSYEPSIYYEDAIHAGMQGVIPKEQIRSLIPTMLSLCEGEAPDNAFESPRTSHLRLNNGNKPFILLLSDREKEIISLCSQGYSSTQIADHTGISVSTVKTYISRITDKLGVNTKREAIALWSRRTNS